MAARLIPVPGTTDTIVLLDYYHDAPNRYAVFRNLSRVAYWLRTQKLGPAEGGAGGAARRPGLFAPGDSRAP